MFFYVQIVKTWLFVFHLSTVCFYSETFSFMLTGEDGSRRFGYCRRLLVSHCRTPCPLPPVLILLSPVFVTDICVDVLCDCQLRAPREYKPLPRSNSQQKLKFLVLSFLKISSKTEWVFSWFILPHHTQFCSNLYSSF